MYAIRLELKTNWRFIFNNKCFFHSLRKGRQVLKRKITVPQIHIYTLIAIIQKVTQYYISSDSDLHFQHSYALMQTSGLLHHIQGTYHDYSFHQPVS